MSRSDRGAALPIVAAGLFLLMVAAAWAVDTSSFYGVLRADRTIADLACLAGSAELPGTSSQAIDQAASYTRTNWPAMQSASLTIGGDQGVLVNARGERVVYEARYNGDPALFRVEVSAIADTSFGRVAGVDSVDLGQIATCSGGDYRDRGLTIPFGALVGGFSGGLFAPNPCGTGSGNCGSLYITGETSGDFVNDIGSGVDVVVTPNPTGSAGDDCRTAPSGAECDIVSSNTGISAGQMGAGMLARLDDPVHECHSWVRSGNGYNCDSLSQVLGGSATPLTTAFPSKPAWWDVSLYGAYNAANTTNHYYWNQPIAHCDSPRLVTIPIVATELSWQLGDPATGWPSGKKDMKVVGMLDVVIIDPNGDDDFTGSSSLRRATAAVVWFGPDATCWDGRLSFGVLNGGDGHDERIVRLEPND
jgi:hypothetical protein